MKKKSGYIDFNPGLSLLLLCFIFSVQMAIWCVLLASTIYWPMLASEMKGRRALTVAVKSPRTTVCVTWPWRKPCRRCRPSVTCVRPSCRDTPSTITSVTCVQKGKRAARWQPVTVTVTPGDSPLTGQRSLYLLFLVHFGSVDDVCFTVQVVAARLSMGTAVTRAPFSDLV